MLISQVDFHMKNLKTVPVKNFLPMTAILLPASNSISVIFLDTQSLIELAAY